MFWSYNHQAYKVCRKQQGNLLYVLLKRLWRQLIVYHHQTLNFHLCFERAGRRRASMRRGDKLVLKSGKDDVNNIAAGALLTPVLIQTVEARATVLKHWKQQDTRIKLSVPIHYCWLWDLSPYWKRKWANVRCHNRQIICRLSKLSHKKKNVMK